MLFKNGLVFLLEEKGFAKRDILVEGGKIIKIEKNISGDSYYDCTDKYVMPGLIEAHSHIGLLETGIGWEGADGNEVSNPLTPGMRAIDAINPFDVAFEAALKGGVTVACAGPGSANVIGGQFTVIKLVGNVVEDMIIRETAAMKCAFGENPKRVYGKANKAPVTRMGIAYLLRKALTDASNYKLKKEKALAEGDKYFAVDLEMEALLPVINREIPLKAHVHRADDICTVIRIAKEFNLKLTLDHCTEGFLISDYLKEQGYPAIVGPSFGAKGKVETKDKGFFNVRVLNDAGIKVAITTDHTVTPQDSLIMCAALAVKAGLSEFDALKAVTINPAEILEIDNIKGKIEVGMDADLVIWDNNPLNFQSEVESVFIEGEEILLW
ncbi:MAG: amidohydrolase [Clostridium sp.]